MMISSEEYYKNCLKRKTATQIMTEICNLKNEIVRLKNTMEHPNYGKEFVSVPGEDIQLWYARLYLERAKEALAEVGGTYTPSQAEMKATEFDESIPFITKMELAINTINIRLVRTVTIGENCASLTCMRRFAPELTQTRQIGKEVFLDCIRNLHMGEWCRKYDPERFGLLILDGTWWTLDVLYGDDRKPITISGNNVYPYNFKELYERFDIERYDEDGDFVCYTSK